MGQATRTSKLLLDLGKREEGGANPGKRASLEATADVLNQARAFYLDFFLAHAQKLSERVSYYSEKHLEMRTRALSPNELLTWAESHTVATRDHPHPWEGWNFSERCRIGRQRGTGSHQPFSNGPPPNHGMHNFYAPGSPEARVFSTQLPRWSTDISMSTTAS